MSRFEKFKNILIFFYGNNFTAEEVVAHSEYIGTPVSTTSAKNFIYILNREDCVLKVIAGGGHKKTVWKLLPKFLQVNNFSHNTNRKIVKIPKDSQVVYKNKYDQLTRDCVFINYAKPNYTHKMEEYSDSYHDQMKLGHAESPRKRVYVGGTWGQV